MPQKKQYCVDVDYEVPKKLKWYYAPVFTAFWIILYFAVVTTQISHLPTPLTRKDELRRPNAFIAERAQQTLLGLTRIGPRVVGSIANEVTTIEFLTQEISKIQSEASDYFQLDLDVQVVSGNYIHWEMVNMYQGVQNVVVKLSAKNNTSDNYLLINSHFDSVPGSVGAADDGSMVATMIEVLRVIAKSNGPLAHPIVFLFNGAEENPLQTSHGFITQHKWAKNCKALVNLDSAGAGGREILFQSGPGHPWLMRYYREVPHPFATTLGEEIFQAELIPSDTDFRIFRDFGGVPGLDMAYVFDGYGYHTEYDRFSNVPMGSLQNTGDNVLSLATAIGNAPEMYDTAQHKDGHVIFYDFLSWFMIFYTFNTSIIINVVICLVAFIAIGISLFFMSARSGLGWPSIIGRYGITLAIQLMSLALGVALVILIAVFMDAIGCSMTWYYENYLIIGLYFCPMFFCMGIFPALYIERTKRDMLSLGFRIQLFMHSHCLILILLTIVLTAFGIRSSFMCMMAILFDIAALIINLITKWHRKAYWFAITVIICQVLPFLYYTSIAQAIFYTIIPMRGRAGSTANPDAIISLGAALFAVLFAGFLMPLYLFFRKTRTILLSFLGITLLFIVIAVTPAGFPYKAKDAAQRYSMLHVRRVLHHADGTDRIDESGVYIYPQDRHTSKADAYINAIGEKHKFTEYCDVEMLCGMPLYNHRWHAGREQSFWVPLDEQPNLPSAKPLLTLISKNAVPSANTQRYSYSLVGPDHMGIFIGPKSDAKIVNWSFNNTMLRDNWTPPFFIYFSYGKDNSALEFYIDVESSTGDFNVPHLEIGIGGHWPHQTNKRSSKFEEFVQSFPEYASITDWVATYESWLF